MNLLREKCVETREEIEVAARNKADRIELCSRLDAGGFTPSVSLAEFAVQKGLSVVVMIRGRADFLITPDELALLSGEMRSFRDTGISGFAFGFLTAKKEPDIGALETLLAERDGKETVFHMAFDEIPRDRQFAAIDTLSEMGFTRILTKGGSGTAAENAPRLKALHLYAKDRIALLAGGKVTDANYRDLYEKTGIPQFHGRKLAGP